MAFLSAPFLLLFLPLTLLAFHLACRRAPGLAAPLLLVASLGFYAAIDPAGLPLLLASMLVNYGLGVRIRRDPARRRRWITLGVLLNLLPLALYKYLGTPGAVVTPGAFALAGLPLGLSFYTFQQIGFLLDCRRDDVPRLGPLHHGLFAGFFAQMPAGPISRYRDLAPQLLRLGQPVPGALVLAGLSLFVLGLGKKLVFADAIGRLVDAVHALVAMGGRPAPLESALACWGFTLQLYFDFSGYSDMALGLGLCLGLWLPVNFNSPLKAASFSALVDRWHMSLVAWIREYVYQPLFQAVRRWPLGEPTRRRLIAWALSTVVSMGLLAAWHGAKASLLLGGLLAGVLIILSQLPALARPVHRAPVPAWRRRLRRIGGHLAVLLAFSLLGLVNRANDLDSLTTLLAGLVDLGAQGVSPGVAAWLPAPLAEALPASGFLPGLPEHRRVDLLILLVASLAVFVAPNTMQLFGLLRPTPTAPEGQAPVLAWRPGAAWGVALGGVVLLVLLFGETPGSGFIYARF
ncbi:MBOAT family O-acyltransferase [Pseudomonas mangiferae]|uniref:Probable alginate O-acetylase n=1 Tax=Pseudomonas mangiferae TaxID=2593654 RepID=A0A553H0A2_9PSED|nr:MBOAT family O-acyltransferase [Pseudomonas mangiferae]TRX75184.1 MBOAT family protein [Pseudomonas mangiferae]